MEDQKECYMRDIVLREHWYLLFLCGVGMCMYVCIYEYGSQRSIWGVISQEWSTLFFESLSLGPGLTS